MQYEPQATGQDIQRIKDRLANYELEILHDDGLYRHLYCSWPDDPYGRNNCSFHVVTAPNTVTIYGDWMNAYTLHREPDMLRDFCNVTRVDYQYWAEKLDLDYGPKFEAIKAIDKDLFLKEIREELAGYDYGEETIDKYIKEIAEEIQFEPIYGSPVHQLLDLATWSTNEISTGEIVDLTDTFGEHYTHEWICTCLALQWAANTYCTQKDNQ